MAMDTSVEEFPNMTCPDIDRAINKGIYDKTFSAAACVASVGGKIFHRGIYGTATTPPPGRKIPLDTLFDLGDLTKPLASGLAALYLTSRSRIDLGSNLSNTLKIFRDPKFAKVTIDMLLDHTSGLPANTDFYKSIAEHDARATLAHKLMGSEKARGHIEEQVAALRLRYDPGSQEHYSHVGFMVLGWILEGITGKPLDQFLEREIYRPLGVHEDLFFIRHNDQRAQMRLKKRIFAATEQCTERDMLMQGVVSDKNAYALGGVAGHAGLFGTADAVWLLTQTLWAGHKGLDRTFLSGTVRRFWTRSRRLRNMTRALAWDTPCANNASVGKRYSRTSVGDVGTTGCSVWIDLSSDIIGVVLTNAAHPSSENKETPLHKFRSHIYELIAKEGESLPSINDGARGSAAF